MPLLSQGLYVSVFSIITYCPKSPLYATVVYMAHLDFVNHIGLIVCVYMLSDNSDILMQVLNQHIDCTSYCMYVTFYLVPLEISLWVFL